MVAVMVVIANNENADQWILKAAFEYRPCRQK